MKYLIGIISGIALAVGGALVVSSQTSNASAGPLTPSSALAPQKQMQAPTKTATRTLAKQPANTLTGELSRNNAGALELKLTIRQNGVLVDRDVRILAAHAKVTNRAGRLVQLPLDASTARVSGVTLPRLRWSLDQDGQPTPTINATRIVVIATTPPDQTDNSNETADQTDTSNETADQADTSNETADQAESTNEKADQAESTDGADKQND